MQIPLVMTIIGKDRTGLVRSLAGLVAEHGGNWMESRMCRLGGEFAGILRVHVPADSRATLEEKLAQLDGLSVTVRSDGDAVAGEQRIAYLEVVGPDKPGIVREITSELAAQGVNVEELSTECVSAPMSGEPLFQARLKLSLPEDTNAAKLRRSLAKPAGDLGLDFSVTGD